MIGQFDRLTEFSYSYAFIEQFSRINGFQFTAAPFLPSLVLENKLAFDVSLASRNGMLLFLQFKIPSLRQGIRPCTPELHGVTHFKVQLQDVQHRLLRNLQASGQAVFYASPLFNEHLQLSTAYERGRVLQESIFISPLRVPAGRHSIVYDIHKNCYFCSEPQRIPLTEIGYESFLSKIENQLIDKSANVYDRDIVFRLLGNMRDIIRISQLDTDRLDETKFSDSPISGILYLARKYFKCQVIFVKQSDPSI